MTATILALAALVISALALAVALARLPRAGWTTAANHLAQRITEHENWHGSPEGQERAPFAPGRSPRLGVVPSEGVRTGGPGRAVSEAADITQLHPTIPMDNTGPYRDVPPVDNANSAGEES